MATRSMRWFSGWGHPHLSDESLVELHSLLLAGEHGVAARYLRHVKQCDPCATRLEALREDCADLRRDILAAVDGHITPARLDRQYDVIARRLEGSPGRLLPVPVAARRPAPVPSSLRRWVAMAAACGLVIGIGAGRLLGPAGPPTATQWGAGGPPAQVLPRTAEETDEQMLVEIDAALARSRTKEFRALDELTPRISEARARR